MIGIDQLAKIAYEAWNASRAFNHDIKHVLPWDRLDVRLRAAWIAAVQAVRAEMAKH